MQYSGIIRICFKVTFHIGHLGSHRKVCLHSKSQKKSLAPTPAMNLINSNSKNKHAPTPAKSIRFLGQPIELPCRRRFFPFPGQSHGLPGAAAGGAHGGGAGRGGGGVLVGGDGTGSPWVWVLAHFLEFV